MGHLKAHKQGDLGMFEHVRGFRYVHVN